MKTRYVGVDLTSAFVAKRNPRPVDVAILEDEQLRLTRWSWPEPDIVNAAGRYLAGSFSDAIEWEPERTVVCIDGPHALSSRQNEPRLAEKRLSTPGRTPYDLPDAGEPRPFSGYIRSSILLFRALLGHNLGYRLAGLAQTPRGMATLFEVFPGAAWSVLLGRRAPRKSSREGRLVRADIWSALGLRILDAPELPSADQNDAIVAALLGRWARDRPDSVELVGEAPDGDPLREGLILHAVRQLGQVDHPSRDQPVRWAVGHARPA